jgi:hypothetical protein
MRDNGINFANINKEQSVNKKCKRLGNTATKKELAEAHRIKMEMKILMNEHNRKQLIDNPEWIYANISKHHEHYGDTPKEHEKRKLKI